jgi:hypothetical protein
MSASSIFPFCHVYDIPLPAHEFRFSAGILTTFPSRQITMGSAVRLCSAMARGTAFLVPLQHETLLLSQTGFCLMSLASWLHRIYRQFKNKA